MITPATVDQLATLSALAITPEDATQFATDLSEVVTYMTILNQPLDITQGDAPISDPVWRPDTPEFLKNITRHLPMQNGYFSVPKIQTD